MRAWEQFGLRSGLYWIDYLSKPSWSKSKSKDSTMNESGNRVRNIDRIRADHAGHFERKESHSEDRIVPESEIDYPKGFNRSALRRHLIVSNIVFTLRWSDERMRRVMRRQAQRGRSLLRFVRVLKR